MIVKEFILRILMVLMILVKYIITQVMPDTAKLVVLKQDFLQMESYATTVITTKILLMFLIQDLIFQVMIRFLSN